MAVQDIRNIAIIAHVDHGKTTLIDEILKQAELFNERDAVQECFLDSNDLERERGITILSKNISVNYKGVKINSIDTPGHSDFAGQVERVLKLADGVLLLVDAAEGPMPQTRFVLNKALELDLKCVVIINKIDKPDERHQEVVDKVFDLFVELGATDEQLDFPLLYASGKDGWASTDPTGGDSILPLMDAIIEHVPAPVVHEGPVQMQIMSLDHSDYLGRIGIGRVYRGTLDLKKPLRVLKQDGTSKLIQLKQLLTFEGLSRQETESVSCGDLCAVVGIEDIFIGDTLADAEEPEALPPISMDEPTISMMFRANNSPFFGRDAKFSTSRHIRERLLRETERDVALSVEETGSEAFKVNGRGVLHLSILMENMRREGYEMTVSQPHVIFHDNNGKKEEPIEILTIDTPEESVGKIIELVGQRKGTMLKMEKHEARTYLEFHIPTRGTIGLRSKVMTATAGEAVLAHRFVHYAPFTGEITHRNNGVLISMADGISVAFAIDGLQQRGIFFINPGEECYEGMIVGEHCTDSDLVVNVQRGKQLTNMRASGSDRNMKIAPASEMSLEEALEYINNDELVEVTPNFIRLRKILLKETDRKRDRRQAKD